MGNCGPQNQGSYRSNKGNIKPYDLLKIRDNKLNN